MNDEIRIQWHDQWSIDPGTGEWNVPEAVTFHAATSSQVELSGGAVVVECSGCVDGLGVGYVGNGSGKLRLNGIQVDLTGSYVVVVSYANGDAGARSAIANVNGVAQQVLFPSTGNGQATQSLSFQANFDSGVENTIEFSNDSAWAPDFDYVRVIFGN